MDPAGTQRSLADQEAAISRHEQSIQIAHQSLAALARSVDTLVQRLNQAPSLGAAGDQETSVPASSYACDPDPYDGDLGKCRGFILQCRLVFSQRAHLFPSDRSKINYIIGRLRGRALAWAQASSGARPDTLPFDTFLSRFKQIFDRPDHAGCAGDKLFTLRQGNRSVADFAVDFGILAAESGWNEPALLCAFRRGLNDPVRDALAMGTRPTVLAELVNRAIELDNHQRARRQERVSHPTRTHSPARSRFSPVREPPTTSSGGPRSGTEEPMQLGGARLSPNERRRRFTSASCLYCGQSGHFIASCPTRPKDRARQLE